MSYATIAGNADPRRYDEEEEAASAMTDDEANEIANDWDMESNACKQEVEAITSMCDRSGGTLEFVGPWS